MTLSQLIQFGFKTGHAKRFIKNVKHITNASNNDNIKETSYNNTNVVVLGETGVGKSTLIQSIDAFINGCEFVDVDCTKKSFTKSNAQSQTQDCHVHRLFLKNLNITINNHDNKFGCLTLIDKPGIGDTSGIDQDEQNIDKIFKCLLSDTIPNNSINVFAFLMQRGTNRATTKLKYIVNQFKCYLPHCAIKHFVVILTRSSVESLFE